MNIREVRKKIKSVSNVKKITKAMQLVSAIKMKRAQEAALSGKPYQSNLELVIRKVFKNVDVSYSDLLEKKENANRDLMIFVSTDKGLCGGFNFNLFRFLLKEIDFDKSDFIVVGKKGSDFIIRMGGKIIADFSSTVALESVSAIFNLTLKTYLEGSYRTTSIVYNQFISTLKNQPTKKQLFPIEYKTDEKDQDKVTDFEYTIEPSAEKIVDSLLKDFAAEMIRDALVQNTAGEHSSRMMAMKNATDNATDVMYSLTLLRNKIRQEKITYELLDMVTANESVQES